MACSTQRVRDGQETNEVMEWQEMITCTSTGLYSNPCTSTGLYSNPYRDSSQPEIKTIRWTDWVLHKEAKTMMNCATRLSGVVSLYRLKGVSCVSDLGHTGHPFLWSLASL